MVSRAERSALANWWWTVDRWLLAALGALIVLGLVLTLAASPPVAERLGLPTFHFVNRQMAFLVPAIAVLFVTSFLSPRHVRRTALIVFIVSMALIIAALLFGHEVKGARRWIFGIQPSEFVKPAFVILAAWAFSEGGKAPDVPGNLLALLLLPVTIVPLILQPDFGQTMLISLVWAALFFMAGLHWFWVAGIGGIGISGMLVAYKFVPHVRARIDQIHRSELGAASSTHSRSIRRSTVSCRRLVRQGAGRGHDQAHPARRAYRFHLRRDGRGIRHRRPVCCSSRSSPSSCCAACCRRRATRIRSAVSPRPASSCCSASRARSIWRSICI